MEFNIQEVKMQKDLKRMTNKKVGISKDDSTWFRRAATSQ